MRIIPSYREGSPPLIQRVYLLKLSTYFQTCKWLLSLIYDYMAFKMKSHYQLLLALVLGAVLGTVLHSQADLPWLNSLNTHFLLPIGQIFLRLIFMIVVPMIFSAIILGVYELGKGQGLGQVAGKTLFYTVIARSCSVLIGITLVNFFEPGKGVEIDSAVLAQQAQAISTIQGNVAAAKPLSQALVDLIPKNPLDAAVRAHPQMVAMLQQDMHTPSTLGDSVGQLREIVRT